MQLEIYIPPSNPLRSYEYIFHIVTMSYQLLEYRSHEITTKNVSTYYIKLNLTTSTHTIQIVVTIHESKYLIRVKDGTEAHGKFQWIFLLTGLYQAPPTLYINKLNPAHLHSCGLGCYRYSFSIWQDASHYKPAKSQ